MKHTNPVVSLSSIILTVLLLGWLGIDLLMEGGMAFNPGLLTAHASPAKPDIQGFKSHADFERECKRCHQPLKSDQADLCLDCHGNVATEITESSGVHAAIENVSACRLCHPDHRGREYSPSTAASKYYNHDNTGFRLIKHQVNFNATDMDCGACHTNYLQGDYQISQEVCTACHEEQDPGFMQQHLADYGSLACLECHNGADQMADFTHETSQFPLTGKHSSLTCNQCHLGTDSLPQFASLSSTCSNCHSEPNLHRGVFDNQCESCHTVDGWIPAILDGQLFDHTIQGNFSLVLHTNQSNADLACRDCHIADFISPTGPVCLDCHAKSAPELMASHTQQFGVACTNCHDGVDRYSNFDHNQYFLLDGSHIDLECARCHGTDPATAVYQGLGKECVNCHAEPDIHAGTFGVTCQDCHSTAAWSPAALRVHDFPLDHGEQGLVACETCHAIRYTEYTCYTCHEHSQEKIIAEHSEENISSIDLQNCIKCHPTGKKEEKD